MVAPVEPRVLRAEKESVVPSPTELARLALMAVLGVGAFLVLWKYVQGPAARKATPNPKPAVAAGLVIPKLIEAESLVVKSRQGAFEFILQGTTDFPRGGWSRNGQMFAMNASAKDAIEFALPVKEPGRYRLSVFLTKAVDYGIVRFSVDGKPAGKPIDLYSGGTDVVPTGAIALGSYALQGKNDTLRLEVIGHHPENRAPHFQFGIDGIVLEKETP